MVIEDAISLPGTAGRTNEDAWGSAGRFAWVIDGATSLLPLAGGVGPAEWAASLSSAMSAEAPSAGSPVDLAGRAVARAASVLGLPPGGDPAAVPSAAGVVVRDCGGLLDIALWGDCGVAVGADGGLPRLFEDRRLAALDGFRQAEMARLESLSGGYGPAEAEYLHRLALDIRCSLNRPGGYPALTPDGAGVPLAGTFTGIPASRALLYSDGLAWAWEGFGVANPEDLLSGRVPLRAALAALREAEGRDPSCRAVRRFKPGDDATGVLVSVPVP